MVRFYIIGFGLLLLFDTLGQTSFKLVSMYAHPLELSLDWVVRVVSNHWLYVTGLSYTGAFITWMILLKKAPVGPAFAASHLQIVTVMLVSVYCFNETLSWNQIGGALLIIAGIIALALAEKKLHNSDANGSDCDE